MKYVILIFLIGLVIYWAYRAIASLFGRSSSASVPALVPQARAELDVSVSDSGEGGMPVITIRSGGATLGIQSVRQESGRYILTAEKLADNVAVISVEKKS